MEQEKSSKRGQKMPKTQKFDVQTPTREAFIDITQPVADEVRKSKVPSGICVVYVPHTTAAVTINLLMTLRKAVPDSLPYLHSEGNSPAHVKSSLVGASVMIFVEEGQLVLGTWQGIFFCEFDGPRRRQVYVKVVPS
jgi:secondary thiamine-phosphate synthase enzyme